MQFPKLYKKSSEGKIEEWEISVIKGEGNHTTVARVLFGEAGGKKQEKFTAYYTGLNIGKKNETTPYEQAVKEAAAKHKKKLKESYVLDFEMAVNGEEDESVEGGIKPMLAHRYQDHKSKVKFPVYVQPKLNGHRCIALKKDGVVGLWTRKRKPILTVPHILKEVSDILMSSPDGSFLDGELYKHGWSLQRISSAGKKVNEDSSKLEFHLYDCGREGVPVRYNSRESFLNELKAYYNLSSVVIVPTSTLHSHEELKICHDKFVSDKYEGLMLRDIWTAYENKRSYSLLKMKEMQDAEFPIIGVKAGKDQTIIFTVIIPSTGYIECDVTMSGAKFGNQKYLHDSSLWVGKLLTVQFQSYTPDGSLEFPIGLQIREDI